MKIVITGATGFVGAALCRHFHQSGHQVTAIGRQALPPAALLRHAAYVREDIINKVGRFDADVCIHAAGLASDTANYNSLYSANVTGTANVLDAARKCRYVIFISSSSVYNFASRQATERNAGPVNLLSDYGKTKLLAEELVSGNIPAHQKRLILRPRAIYGIGDRILLLHILKMIRGRMIFCPVDAQRLTSATHIDNLSYALDCFLKQDIKPPIQTYNVADDHVYAFRDIILKISSVVCGPGFKVINLPAGLLKFLLALNDQVNFSRLLSPVAIKALTEDSILNLKEIKAKLGYKPPHTFYETFESIGNWIHNIGGKKAYFDNLNDMPWN